MVNKLKKIQIATYNIRTDTEEDGNWAWDFRKDKVLELINYHDWDIFGAQELMPNQVESLSQLNDYSSFTEEREGDQLGEGLGIYYKTEMFTCLDKGYFWLSDTPDKASIHPEAGCKRIALWVVLTEIETQTTFLLINTHLDHISDVARLEGMKVLLDLLADKIANYPTVLLGDFNAEPEEIIHDLLKKQFRYAREEHDVLVYGPKGSFQGFDYQLPWSELEDIDYILYKDLTCIKQGVLTDSCDGKYPSDHFPIVATFNFEKEN